MILSIKNQAETFKIRRNKRYFSLNKDIKLYKNKNTKNNYYKQKINGVKQK